MSKYNSLSTNCFGCTVLTNEKVLVADYVKKKLVFLNKEGRIEDEMVLQSMPYDVTNLVKHNLVAVTANDDNELLIIDSKRKCITKKIKLNSSCYGLASFNGKIIVCTGSGLVLLDSELSKPVQNLNIGMKSNDEYVDFNSKYLFYGTEDTVTCSDIEGNIKWRFKDRTILKGARGVKVHKSGIVFIACPDSNTVVAISSCGTQHKSFSIDLVKQPRTLCFDKDDESKLLVCGWEGDLALYNLSF